MAGKKWNIPRSFAEQFKVSDEIKEIFIGLQVRFI